MSLKEIARRANVSIATVSRTINGASHVRPSVARRIRKVIEEVGYYPNAHARALACGRSRIFGLLVSETIQPYIPEIAQTFENLGFEHNYEVILNSITCDPHRLEITLRRMIERRVEAVAVLSLDNEAYSIEFFYQRAVPVVVLDIETAGALRKTVNIDYQHGIRQAVQHLAALRHVRIACISGPAHSKIAVTWKTAFLECMQEIGLEMPSHLLVEGDHTVEAGMNALAALAGLPDRPTAVLCSNDLTAIGVMRKASELALDIPRDLSVVGFGDIHWTKFIIPALTTIRLSQIHIAEIVFRALLDFVEFGENRPLRRVYPIRPDLVLRRSTSLAPNRVEQTRPAQ